MARAAGMKPGSAQIVASASEYVDDAVFDRDFYMEDGRSVLAEMTAHQMIDYQNANSEDQRKVWLPFHFLPGGVGESIGEKLTCGKDSPVARELVNHNLRIAADRPYGLHLLGLTAHVYADTFAHYGFIGANTERNAIDADTFDLQVHDQGVLGYISGKATRMWEKALSFGLSTAFPLGHGAAATYPDRPFLSWSYTQGFQGGHRVERDNASDFVDGCRKLHAMFQNFLAACPQQGQAGTQKTWKAIRPSVARVISTEGDKEARSDAWRAAIRSGNLFGGENRIRPYVGDKWSDSMNAPYFDEDGPPVGTIAKLDVYRFYQAARIHRNFVLTDLLPDHGIIAA